MTTMDLLTSHYRRLRFLGVVALPFLGLLVWSWFLIHATKDAFLGFAHCSTWTLESSRHLEVLEDLQERISHFPYSSSPATDSAPLEVALDRLQASRKELGQRIHSESDPLLVAVDQAMADYLEQVDKVRRTVDLNAERTGSSPDRKRQEEVSRALAHLDHHHRIALSALNDLVRYHREMLEASVQDSRRNATQLSAFAGASLLAALGFGIALGIAFLQRGLKRQADRFVQTLVDTIPDGVVAWDQGGSILTANPGLTALLGKPPGFTCGNLEFSSMMPSEARKRLEAAGPDRAIRINLVHANGSLRAIEARVGTLNRAAGILYAAVLRDVSAQLDRERRLVSSQWQIQVGRQVASTARDLERALHPMLFAQEILQQSVPVDSSQAEALQTLQRSSEQAAVLLRQFSRMAGEAGEAPDVRYFDLQACLMEVIEAIQTERGTLHGIEMNLDPSPCPIRGPVGAVRRCFEVLIQRALDAAAGTTPIRVNSRRERNVATVQVLDPAIPPVPESDLARMFDPLFCFAASEPGDGFGLFNVWETMKSIGGTVEIALTQDGWTEFTLRFHLEEGT
ncbi:ATP-binding protein [Mesoterricola silvestris]|uniref:histidine kinase n=1 Tax=Mesoterricola silvestris TaxID=2927979 RepID=A0AA48GHU0_9BACT|nr:ATP-binding protein [Mesoterricola silvestris]BDU73151.1 hypothetical protein METEAL_23250 [Mesoterricola silvestris]